MPRLRYHRNVGKRTDQSPTEAARAFGVGHLTRHLFICLGPDCTDLENGERGISQCLDSLHDPAQREAVLTTEGAVLVIVAREVLSARRLEST